MKKKRMIIGLLSLLLFSATLSVSASEYTSVRDNAYETEQNLNKLDALLDEKQEKINKLEEALAETEHKIPIEDADLKSKEKAEAFDKVTSTILNEFGVNITHENVDTYIDKLVSLKNISVPEMLKIIREFL